MSKKETRTKIVPCRFYKELIELSHSLPLLSENITHIANVLHSLREQKHSIALSLPSSESLRETIVLIEQKQQLIHKFCLELSKVKYAEVVNGLDYTNNQYVVISHGRNDPGHDWNHDHDHVHIALNMITKA